MAKTIMIVDDSPSFRTVVQIALTKAGFEVLQATDGEHAKSLLDGRKLGLIVCDVNMPKLDGKGLLNHLKTTQAYKFTPVLMLTTESSEAKRNEYRAAGAKGWLTKPFQPSALVGAAQRLCVA